MSQERSPYAPIMPANKVILNLDDVQILPTTNLTNDKRAERELPEVKELPVPEFLARPPQHAEDIEDSYRPPTEPPTIYTTAELLLLRPRQRDLDYALVDPTDDLVPQGRLMTLNNRTRAGFRVGVGYRNNEEHWDLGLFYTYLRTGDQFGVVAPSGGIIYPTLTRPGLTDLVTSAYATTRLQYDVYDIEVGRTFGKHDGSHFRAFGGFRFANVYQRFTAYYNGVTANNALIDLNSRFDGVGPMIGGEGTLQFGSGFGAYLRTSGGLMVGTIRTPFMEFNNANNTLYTDYTTGRASKTVPVMNLGLGLTWQRKHLTFRVGYEVTHWLNVLERPTFVDDFSPGKVFQRETDLSLDGVFFQLGLSF
jgi:hypothetical protein